MTIKLILVAVFAIVIAAFLKPTGSYKEWHLVLLGVAVLLVSVISSLLFGYDPLEVVTLQSSSGPERGIMAGYALIAGVGARSIFRALIRK